MQWTGWLGYYQDSEEGYRVSKCHHGNRARYTGWAPCAPTNPYASHGWLMLDCHDSAEAAREQCEAHHKDTAK